MKLATDKSHRDFFYKHGYIEFDELFTPAQIDNLNEVINRILCKKLAIKPEQLHRQSPNDLFLQGRDLFRQDESLKKQLLHSRLADIAIELMEVRSLRIGYDELLIGQSKKPILKTAYDDFLNLEATLQERSCIKPVICGLMICLEPAQSIENLSPFFPKKAGNGVFFKADIPFDLHFLSENEGRYLLIAYADPRTVYILNENDPHVHTLKRLGYVFGDRLSDKLNPLVSK